MRRAIGGELLLASAFYGPAMIQGSADDSLQMRGMVMQRVFAVSGPEQVRERQLCGC
jgi:hypothetical protein